MLGGELRSTVRDKSRVFLLNALLDLLSWLNHPA
jgi:hypothetical protein